LNKGDASISVLINNRKASENWGLSLNQMDECNQVLVVMEALASYDI
jgi:hypothetical protein